MHHFYAPRSFLNSLSRYALTFGNPRKNGQKSTPDFLLPIHKKALPGASVRDSSGIGRSGPLGFVFVESDSGALPRITKPCGLQERYSG